MILEALFEARVLIEPCRHHYNTRRPHSALGCRVPAPLTIALTPPNLDQPLT